jgi:carbamate kinase
VVIAIGGNALLPPGEDGTRAQQLRNAERLARALIPLARRKERILLIHGNGPQVGNLLLRMEESVTKVPPLPMDFCVAQSQGEMGYLLEQALRNRLRSARLQMPVASVLTQVEVDADDPAFAKPTKPIGPFLSRYRARLLRREGKAVVEDSGRGYRRVVASPRPRHVLGLETVRMLLDRDLLVIAGGGGGVPVVRTARRGHQGVEAVIDKDYTAGLMAVELGASLLAILTDVDQVFLRYGTPERKGLRKLSVNEARSYLEAGEFPPGSMGPKIETAVEFVESTGGEALITSAARLAAGLAGRAGTWLRPSNRLPFNGGAR